MSRMQNIIEKAEREGALRHVIQTFTDPVAGVPGNGGPPSGASVVLAPELTELADMAAPPVMPAPRPTRAINNLRLHPSVSAVTAGGSTVAEQYRALRTRILHADNGTPVHVLLVTSPGRGEGKSVTVANLALAMAQELNQRICVVDADLRAPDMQRLFGLPDGPGLADVLAERVELEDALVTIEDRHVTVLPAGHPSARATELLGTAAMRRTIEMLRSRFDRVLIDTPAAVPLADVGVLTPLVDSIALVVRSGVTSKPSIHEAVGMLDPSKLLGVVLTDAA